MPVGNTMKSSVCSLKSAPNNVETFICNDYFENIQAIIFRHINTKLGNDIIRNNPSCPNIREWSNAGTKG